MKMLSKYAHNWNGTTQTELAGLFPFSIIIQDTEHEVLKLYCYFELTSFHSRCFLLLLLLL